MHERHDPPRPAQRRLHQLDGLRGVAALLVLVHHSAAPSIRAALEVHGYPALGKLISWTTASGVELFFVLSGVVLLRPYLRRERAFDVVSYFRRRVERIAPPYLAAWVLAGAVIALTTATPSWFSDHLPLFTWSGWAAQAFVLRFTDELYNGAWWSLAVEILFYLVAPVVVLIGAMRRLRPWHGLAVLGIAAVGASLLMGLVSVEHLPLAMVYSLGCYSACFCGGVLLARFDLSPRTGAVLVAIGVAWVLAASSRLHWLNYHVGYGFLYTGIVHHLISGRARTPLLASPLAVWLGERSYSLFLVHVSVFQLVDHVLAHLFPSRSAAYLAVTRLVGIPGAFLVAMVLFTLIERRFARGLVTGGEFWPPLWRPSRTPPAPISSRTAAGA